MKRASKFVVSPSWKLLLTDMQVDVTAVLAYAGLPRDLFNRDNSTLTPKEYYDLWRGVEQAAGDIEMPLLLAEHLSVEAFDPPIFASICSQNMNAALQRLSQYKPLIGPMIMAIDVSKTATRMKISCYSYQGEMPNSLGLTELVFFTQLARLATRENINPIKVELSRLPDNIEAYSSFFGCELTKSNCFAISFSADDANKPFLTSNVAMWEFFEAKLNQKLADLDASASTVERVRAVLFESLPSGDSSIETVTDRLAMSKRTLQRKLTAEAETFQTVLQTVRSELADHYLAKSSMSLGEISFLLGFQESNSFIRAYSSWKGMSPGSYLEQCH